MNKEVLQERLGFYNPWWLDHKVPEALAPEFKRLVFSRIVDYLKLDRVVVLKGPRRTGKSTLLYQLIDYWLQQGIDPKRIVYLNFEDAKLREDLHQLLRVYSEITLQDLATGEERFVVLDEVQLLPDWANLVKSFFDKKYPIKFLVSGSAVSLIDKGSESLAGRTVEEVVLPLPFKEWVGYHEPDLRNHEQIAVGEYPVWKQRLDLWWQKYLQHGGFAHLLTVDDSALLPKLLFEDVVQKVIYRDLVDLYGIREPVLLEKIFYYVVGTSSGLINVSNLSSLVGANRELVTSYLALLKQAWLYFELRKFSRSVKQVINSVPKIHLIDPGLFQLTTQATLAQKWETAIAGQLWQQYSRESYYWRDREEVDVVLAIEERLYPVEIKSGTGVEKAGLRELLKFMQRLGVKIGHVVYDGDERSTEIDGMRINWWPVTKFLWWPKECLGV